MQVGTIIKLKRDLLDSHKGDIGVCYEEYHLGNAIGYSIILYNGNYDGFSSKEALDMLEEVGFCPEVSFYQFSNVMKLTTDYKNGFFKPAFGV